jgi:hypothetical protein
MLGFHCMRIDRLPQGLMLLQMKGPDAKPNGAALLLEIDMTVKDSSKTPSTMQA